MALNTEDIKNNYPVPAYNFKVNINQETYGFARVTGLSIQYDTITYRHGLSIQEGTHYITGLLQPINLILEKGIISSGSILLEWINGVQSGQVKRQDVTINLCDEAGDPIISWQVYDAFPTGLNAPTFDAANSQVAIESIQLTASSLRITYQKTGQTGGAIPSGGILDLESIISRLF